MENETCQCCTCGYEWRKGQDGSHSCSEALLKKIKTLEADNPYKKFEYCCDVKCPNLLSVMGDTWCKIDDVGCLKTAKEFHHWLKENNYKITKGK